MTEHTIPGGVAWKYNICVNTKKIFAKAQRFQHPRFQEHCLVCGLCKTVKIILPGRF